jgi:negative regulator of flagellin synthesis FlgM
MKIDPTTMKAAAIGPVSDERPRTAKNDTPSRQPASTVHVSPLASQLQSIDKADAGGSVDASRVAHLKLAIAQGRYTVDAEKIADRLLESAREALRGPKS